MRVAIAGAGAVGRSIARELIENGHQVLLIDKNPGSIRPERVPHAEWLLADSCEMSSLEEAQLDKCDVVIAARVARETFGIQQVVARIYDPGRAEVYQRLGITTVATVKWTADQVLRRLLPAGAEPDFRDPSGTIRLDQVPATEAWIGERTVKFQEQSTSRIAWIDRLGEGMLPTKDTVIQEGDLLHLVMREENAAHAYAVLESGPDDD